MGNNIEKLKRMHLMNGYKDPEFIAIYKKQIKWIPLDDTMATILSEATTMDWNPLIFAIFYFKLDLV